MAATSSGANRRTGGLGDTLSVLIAPDKYKGSLTASQVANAIAAGLRQGHPGIHTREVPVADGGDGTLEAFLADGYYPRHIVVTGPDGQERPSMVALKGTTAVVETALTSGLALHGNMPPIPLTATSRGVGDALVAALDAGAQRIIVGLGGSACTDAGAGMLQALGVRLLDNAGTELPPGGAALGGLTSVDASGLDPRIHNTEIILATDVVNPLCGPQGAAAVYGPQKGADAKQIALLDHALGHFASFLSWDTALLSGAGAAGGIGFAALALLGATTRPGIELVLELLDFEAQLAGTDLVITGEGKLDEQSFQGKAAFGVLLAAAQHGIPTIAVCGASQLDPGPRTPNFTAVHTLTDLEPHLPSAIAHAEQLLVALSATIPLPISQETSRQRS